MFSWMYCSSLSASVGLTWKFWTIAGQIMPSRIAERTSSASPTDGSCHVRRQMLAKNNTAQISATPIKMLRAGSSAFSPV
jgi:hypothetical protein